MGYLIKIGVFILYENLCLTVLFVSTTTLFADRVRINDKDIVDVEFEPIEVGSGSFDSQIFRIADIKSEIKGVMVWNYGVKP